MAKLICWIFGHRFLQKASGWKRCQRCGMEVAPIPVFLRAAMRLLHKNIAGTFNRTYEEDAAIRFPRSAPKVNPWQN